MVFSIDEIKRYLGTQESIGDAISNLDEQAIVSCMPIAEANDLCLKKNEANLEKYEAMIGMKEQKYRQRTLYRNSGGKSGRRWMACSPRWRHVDDKTDTKYQICYWVNYGDNNTYGQFTVEQIQRWFADPEIQLHQLGGTKER